jgi:putative methionine-R-sulfoxide reductase with GAF domain
VQIIDQRGLDWRDKARLFMLSLPVSLVISGAVATFGFLTGASKGPPKLVFGVIAVTLTIVTALCAWLRQSKSSGYKRLAARLAQATAGAGKPVLIALGNLCKADPADLSTKIESLRERVLETARSVCGDKPVDQKRAVLYEFRASDGALVRAAWIGDSEPRAAFEATDVPEGRAVVEFAQMKAGGVRVDRVDDVRRQQPRGRVDLYRCRYRSFISTPVVIGSDSYGLLAVDSMSPSTFGETDEGTITLLAGVLAAGLAHVETQLRHSTTV